MVSEISNFLVECVKNLDPQAGSRCIKVQFLQGCSRTLVLKQWRVRLFVSELRTLEFFRYLTF